jgi:hypothetical protein
MSTFAVFGMNEHFAREEAKRKVRAFKIEKGQRIELSMSQWLQAVEDRVVKIMDGKRVAQLSSMFDAPPVRRRIRRAHPEAGAVPRRNHQSESCRRMTCGGSRRPSFHGWTTRRNRQQPPDPHPHLSR